MANIAVVYGTRPEWLKLAPVVRALEHRGHVVTCIPTGQHTDLLPFTARCDIALQSARLEHRADDPGWVAGRMAEVLDGHFRTHGYAAVVVQGDTASAMAGAKAAMFRGMPVAHVEAGVRSGDERDPEPEEGFRKTIDLWARWHYCPTHLQRKNLIDEGLIRDPAVQAPVTGNTVVDALQDQDYFGPIEHRVARVMVTLHRREAQGAGFREIVAGLVTAAEMHQAIEFIWPTHPNGWAVAELRRAGPPSNLILTPPMTHRAFLALLARSWAVVTDSGGVQEEAAVLGLEAIITRRLTDRPETVDAGFAVVTGFDRTLVADGVQAALALPVRREGFTGYGRGDAAMKIAEHLTDQLEAV